MRNTRHWGVFAALVVAAAGSSEKSVAEPAQPPAAERAVAEPPPKQNAASDALVLDIRHAPATKCDPYDKGGRCADENHWKFASGDAEIPNLAALLQKEADGARRVPGGLISERTVLIHAEPGTPWGRVQAAMNACAEKGIYRIQWRASASKTGGQVLEQWLPIDKGIRGTDPSVILEETRILVYFNAGSGLVRKINAQAVKDDAELVSVLVDRAGRRREAGKTGMPVIVDAAPEVAWCDVIRVVALCGEAKEEHVEFASPLPGGGKGARGPDLERPRDVFERKGIAKPGEKQPAADEPAIFFPDRDVPDHKESEDGKDDPKTNHP